jgi:hypothetical protein
VTRIERPVDPGAVFAGWVGLGVALLVAIGLELIVAIQALVFVVAPAAGLLVGYYAEARSGRRRPWARVLANAAYAGLVTGLALALLYGGLRLLFVYADTGFPDFNRAGQPTCPTGPGCTYARYVRLGQGEELAGRGITDAAGFERAVLAEQLNGGFLLTAGTLLGALGGGLIYGATTRPAEGPRTAAVPASDGPF